MYRFAPRGPQAVLCGFCLALPALWLAACGNSAPLTSALGPVGSGAAKCQGDTAPDFSARSLPSGLSPSPGPEALYLPPPRAPQLENTGVWQALPLLVSGASSYRCGEFVYQDWLYDDHGAAGVPDPNDPQGSTSYLFSPKVGTLTYPTDAVYANNAGDLVEFRVRPLANATAFRLTLGALKDAERTAFTVALGSSAAPVAWPHAANVSSPAELLLTVHGTSAELIRAADGTVLTPAPTVTVDLERLQMEVRLPHAAWNPQRQSVRLAVGVGLWDVAAGNYLQASPTASASAPGGLSQSGAALFNVAFRNEPVTDFSAFSGRTIGDAAVLAKTQANWFRERLQSEVLADGDLSPFFAVVDFAKLADGSSDDSQVPTSGHINRILASRYSFGQGADNLKECGGVTPAYPCDGVYIGQLQPYSIYIPSAAPPASGYGLTLLLHALSANYNQYLGSRHAQSLGDRGTGSIVITPAGRGPDGYYKDTAEADTFEVWADVAGRYPLDPEWTAITGVSMGGFGTWRLGTRYPDLFARAMPIVAGGREYDDQLISLRNVPVTFWTSVLDELQPVVNTEPTVMEMLALGLRIDSRRFETWDHLSPSTNDYYAPGVEFLGEARVERNPAHVSYVMNASEDFARSNVIANKAYWLSELTLGDPALGRGSIDVISGGYGLADPVVMPTVQSNDVYSGGYLEPTLFTRRLIEWQPAVAVPVQDKLVIKASNIGSVTIDPARARVSCKPVIQIDSDVPLRVILKGC